MPIYSFPCDSCKEVFQTICKFGEEETICEKCGSNLKRSMALDMPTVIFKQPQTSSKWENFDYRAKHNMERAEAERRAANAASGETHPYQEINDFDTKGVFDKDGVDNQNPGGLHAPK
jgi:putative FmdB family regulatory protein